MVDKVCLPENMPSLASISHSSVIKTIGKPAVEVMRYASNDTLTVNILHNMYGVGHVNLPPGPSNGLDLLNLSMKL